MNSLCCPVCEQEKGRNSLCKSKVYSSYCSRHLLQAVKYMSDEVKNTSFRYKVSENCFFGRSTELIELYSEIRRRKFNGEQILAQTS
jgi:hypothetical protein